MSILELLKIPLMCLLSCLESALFVLMEIYDKWVYSPLQTLLSPVVARIPRFVTVGTVKYSVFTANIVTWSRTALVIPIAWCLKYNYPMSAFWLVILHDFLDHLDGIVAKVQKQLYGQLDDPLLGGFLDAFCDKIVVCMSLWSVLLTTDFSHMTSLQVAVYLFACVPLIGYEFIIGMVRVQDFYQAKYARHSNSTKNTESPNIAASMEGKLKEKLESVGVACLCIARGTINPAQSTGGIIGIVCLVLSFRFAHGSLMHKLRPRLRQDEQITTRNSSKTPKTTGSPGVMDDSGVIEDRPESPLKESVGIQTELQISYNMKRVASGDISDNDDDDDNRDDDDDDDMETEKADLSEKEEEELRRLGDSLCKPGILPSVSPAARVDKVYTVGCFDLFHEGHIKLLTRLHALGKQVIVGVHDSRSIFRLKKRVPIDSTHRRMANVKKYADIVFCIRGSDPTPFLQCMYDQKEDVSSMYVRGDDMPNFPARAFMEKLMPVHFLPYTESVSSTKIRKEVYNSSKFGPHVQHDDHTMFY